MQNFKWYIEDKFHNVVLSVFGVVVERGVDGGLDTYMLPSWVRKIENKILGL